MRRLPSLRQLLLLLTLACVLPMAGVALGLVAYEDQRARRQLEADTIGMARALIAAVDDRLARSQGALVALARSAAMPHQDFARLRDQALVLQQSIDATSLMLLDATGRQLMDTSQAPETGLGPGTGLQVVQGPQPRQAAVLDLFRVPATQELRVAISVPVPDPGGPLTLHAQIDPARLREVLARQQLPEGWIASVLDRSGTIVARTHDHEHSVGSPARAALVARIAQVPEDAVESMTIDGVPVVTAFSRSPRTGWSVAIGVPRGELRAALMRSTSLLLLATGAVLLVTLALAWRMARSLSASVDALGSAVRASGHRAGLELPQPAFREAWQLGIAFAHAHAALDDAYAALARSEARMAAVLATATDAIVTADEAGNVVLFNEAAERLFRRAAEDVLGKPLESLVPGPLRGLHRDLRESTHPGEVRGMAEGRVIEALRGDGTPFRARAAISIADGAEGRLYTVMLRELPAGPTTRA